MSVRNRSSEKIPPVAAITATEAAAPSEIRRSDRSASLHATASIASAAAPKAITAEEVCTRSCQRISSANGIGHPEVQGSWDATKKQAEEIASSTAGRTNIASRRRRRTPLARQATIAPPNTISSRAYLNHRAVGSSAPSSLT